MARLFSSRLSVLVPVITFALALSAPSVAPAADCSAECDLCPGTAPTCSASCEEIALCFDGSCVGPNIQCCCRGDESDFCLDTPCSSGSTPPPPLPVLPERKALVEDWAVVKASLDEQDEVVAVEALFASRSEFAASLVASSGSPSEPGSTPTPVRERTTLVLDSNVGSPVPVERARHQDFVKSLRASLVEQAGALNGFPSVTAEMFLVRVDFLGPRILFSTDPDLSDHMTDEISEEVDALGRGHEEIDFVFVQVDRRVSEPSVSVIHTRFAR